MRVCPKCKKPGEFYAKSRYCKPCSRKKKRAEYKRNKSSYLARAKTYGKKRRAELNALVDSFRSGPCLDCNKSYSPWIMDFDHRPGTEKKFNIAEMKHRWVSKKRLLDEIAKCDVVCANCHRDRTYKRRWAGISDPSPS